MWNWTFVRAQNRLLLELIELPGEGLVWVYVILEEEEGVPLSDLHALVYRVVG